MLQLSQNVFVSIKFWARVLHASWPACNLGSSGMLIGLLLFRAGASGDLLVTGTPGTGKFTWQLHLLQRLAQLGRTVVVDWANAGSPLLICL